MMTVRPSQLDGLREPIDSASRRCQRQVTSIAKK